MVSASVRSKAMIIMLVVAPIICGDLCWVLFSDVFLSILSSFCNHLAEEEKDGYFTSIVFSLSLGCLCSVSHPQGAWFGLC